MLSAPAARLARRLVSCAAALAGAFAIAASAPSLARAERLPIRSYGPADGLPGTFIQHVTRDSRGFLWFSTRDGLSRFDGVRFVTYGFEHGLPNPTVNFFLEARDGSYWAATNGGGICRLDPLAALGPTGPGDRPLCRVYSLGDGTFANRVNALLEARDGRIWAGTDSGVFHLDRHDATDPADDAAAFEPLALDVPVEESNRGGTHTIVQAPDGTLWFGLGWGLYRYTTDGRRTHFTIHPTIRGDNSYRLLFDQGGRLWLGHQTGLIIMTPPGDVAGSRTGVVPSRPLLPAGSRARPLPFGEPIALPDAPAGSPHAPATNGTSNGAPSRNGASTNGARSTNGGTPPPRAGAIWFDLETHGVPPGVTAVAPFPDGHVWLGTSDGLIEFDGERFRRYSIAEGLSDAIVTSLAADVDDNLWATTMAGGAMKLTRRGFRSYDQGDGLGDSRVHAIYEDARGRIVTVSGDWQIARFDGQRFAHGQPRLASDLQYTWTSQVGYLDRHDQWWLLTNRSVLRLAPGTDPSPLAGRPPIEELPDLTAGQLYEDRQGDIWFALRGNAGLAHWTRRTGQLRRLSAADGTVPREPSAFAEDRGGHLWIGTRGGELFRHADGRFTRLVPPRDPASGAAITALHLDDAGRLWAGSNVDGLLRIDAPESARPRMTSYTRATGLGSNNVRSITSDARGRIYAGTARGVDRLDPSSGLIQHFTTVDGLPSGFVSAAYRDRRGELWFATMRGLARLRPESEERGGAPPVLIGGISVAGTPLSIAHLGESRVAGLQLGPGQRQIQFDFFGLAFGMGESLRYRYKLEGLDRDWSAPVEERTVRYSQLAPREYRFLVSAVRADGVESARPASVTFTVLPALWQRTWVQLLAGGLLIAAAVAAYRVRVTRLLALERVRTRIASDLHDDIGATLAQIAVLSEVVQTQIDPAHAPLRAPLARIAQTSRDAIASMSDIVWAINPRKDSLSAMVLRMREFASEVLPARGLTFTLAEPPHDVPLTADQRRESYLIFKEAVNNVLRHADATHVEIAIGADHRRLRLRVADNGRGFDPLAEAEAGNGLTSMQRRAAALHGTLHITSQPGATAIELDVPL